MAHEMSLQELETAGGAMAARLQKLEDDVERLKAGEEAAARIKKLEVEVERLSEKLEEVEDKQIEQVDELNDLDRKVGNFDSAEGLTEEEVRDIASRQVKRLRNEIEEEPFADDLMRCTANMIDSWYVEPIAERVKKLEDDVEQAGLIAQLEAKVEMLLRRAARAEFELALLKCEPSTAGWVAMNDILFELPAEFEVPDDDEHGKFWSFFLVQLYPEHDAHIRLREDCCDDDLDDVEAVHVNLIREREPPRKVPRLAKMAALAYGRG